MEWYIIQHVLYDLCEEEKHKEFWKDLKWTSAQIILVRDFKKFYRNPDSMIYFLTVNFNYFYKQNK